MRSALLHTTWAPVNTNCQSRQRTRRCGGSLHGSSVRAVINAASEPTTYCEDVQADVVIVGGGGKTTHVLQNIVI